MKISVVVKYIFFTLCFFLLFQLRGQDFSLSYQFDWQGVKVQKISDEIEMRYLYFKDAATGPDSKMMPWFYRSFSINSINTDYNIELSNLRWEELSSEEVQCLDVSYLSDSLLLNYCVQETRKEPFLRIDVLPFRKNGQKTEKLVSFDLKAIASPKLLRTQKANTYTNNSILKSGNFYKISIKESGIHKITYENFQALGIHSTINCNNIAVFGYGGYPLPQSTSITVFDDLPELAIEVVDNNNNNILESGDYVLFYGRGLIQWTETTGTLYKFEHQINVYDTLAYYFVNVESGVGTKKRITGLDSETATATHQVNSYYYYDVYEKDRYIAAETGTRWFSDEYKSTTSYDYTFNVKGIDISQKMFFDIYFAAQSSSTSIFTTTINNSTSFNTTIASSLTGALTQSSYSNFTPNSETISLKISYNKPSNSSIGWLDYIAIHATCALAQNSSLVAFRNPEIVGSGNIAQYSFNTLGKNSIIWDVSEHHNVKKVNAVQTGNLLTFTLRADSLREFVAHDGTAYFTVNPVGRVENQDLHALSDLDFVIITHPTFLAAANRLADFRRSNDNMKVAVVTTQQIYNEFSSGSAELSAIRNFLKMFYERETASSMPKNALLIGKTSYDPRGIKGTALCYIPNYQGSSIFSVDNNTSSDNYFGKLANGKGFNNYGSLDIGIGRFPVTTTDQASTLVQKSINYNTKTDNRSLGSWRNNLLLIADDDEGGTWIHMNNTEAIYTSILQPSFPGYNIIKLYCDATKKESSSQGTRYPDMNKSITQRINNGILIGTYFGHGGDNGWAHERILTRSEIESWSNKNALTFLFTACCKFGVYDNESTSPAELTLLNKNGGTIGVIASIRNSSSSANESLGKQIYMHALSKINNQHLTIGEVHAKAQNGYSYEAYSLLGDPSVTLSFPLYSTVTDSINGTAMDVFTDTLRSLDFITIAGHITDENNTVLSNFNGTVYPTVYDKPIQVTTFSNSDPNDNRTFFDQKSTIFKGSAKVENGYFRFSFMLPKDINYEYGLGKISYYAKNETTDAAGFNLVTVGGMNDTIIDDKDGPIIDLFLNDQKFVSGGITDENPLVLATITDKSGLNTSGAGIGHDLVIIIDDDAANAYNANENFQYSENSFTEGQLNYALSNLSVGKHKLKVRAWDILNNMGEQEVEFEVVSNEKLTISHVLNYPNPFTTNTTFFFEHNRPNTQLEVKIAIFTISGKVVKTINQTQFNSGFRSNGITWDGLDDYGDKLAKGIYIYKLQVKTSDGTVCEKIEKIAIL